MTLQSPSRPATITRLMARVTALLLTLLARHIALAAEDPSLMRFDHGTSGYKPKPGTSETLSFEVSGSNTLLMVGWAHDGNFSVTSARYNNVPMKPIADQGVPASRGLRVGLFYLFNPAPGTHELILERNVGQGSTLDYTVGLYTGVKQTGLPDAIAFGGIEGLVHSASISTKSDRSWIIGATYSDKPFSSFGPGIALREKSPDQHHLFDSNGTVPSGFHALSWTLSESQSSGFILASFLPLFHDLGFLAQPRDQTALVRSTVSFSVNPAGLPPYSYQWYFNGTNSPIAGQTNALLVLTNISSVSEGLYSVSLSNDSELALSSSAALTVLDPATSDLSKDSDGDGKTDFSEIFTSGTNPLSRDSDNDGMPDDWEMANGLDPRVNDADGDLDQDGLTNLQEYTLWTTNHLQRPDRSDSLGDGVTDYERRTGGQNNRFYYDRNDRLIGAEYDNGLSIAYVYDGNDNLVRQVHLSRDAETNRLPVLWRFLNGLTNGTPADATYGDADGDGWSNWQEWKAGSKPTDRFSTPQLLSNPGTSIASLALPFIATNFVVGVGQLDGGGAQEIVVGADGDPGTNSNYLLILTQVADGWSTQRLDVGSFGITSIAVGQPTNRPAAGIYVGLRGTNGSGLVMEFMRNGGDWQSNSVALSRDEAAHVGGIRQNGDLLANLATNGLSGALWSLTFSNGLWNPSLMSSNTSHRGIPDHGLVSSRIVRDASIRLLDAGVVESVGGGFEVTKEDALLPGNSIQRSGSGKWYFSTPSPMTWQAAQAYCASYHCALTLPTTDAEDGWLNTHYPVEKWLGLYFKPAFEHPIGDQDPRWYPYYADGSPSTLFSYVANYARYDGYARWADAPQLPNTRGSTVFERQFQDGNYYWLTGGGERFGVAEVTNVSLFTNRWVIEQPGFKQLGGKYSIAKVGRIREGGGNLPSILLSVVDDNGANPGSIDSSDEIVLVEYQISGNDVSTLSFVRNPIKTGALASSTALAAVDFLGTGVDYAFTAEPSGEIYSWSVRNAGDPLERKLFSADYSGRAWHALAGVGMAAGGEGLAGLMVDPTNANACNVIFWPPQAVLLPPELAVIETAPATVVIPSSSPLSSFASVAVRLWDAEGNSATPQLQFQLPGSTTWQFAKLEPTSPLPLTTKPSGENHTLVWNAVGDLGAGVTTNVLLRARASDVSLMGDWSMGTPFHLATTVNPDSDGDGLPDQWERDNFGNLSQTGEGDPDGDGLDNRAEYLAGTNPKDAAKNLSLSVILNDQGLLLRWNAKPVVPFVLESTDEIDGVLVWNRVLADPVSPQIIPPPTANRYFRLRLQP